MYIPPHFAESRTEVLHDLVDAHPLATLVTMSSRGIDANHVPMHLDRSAGTFGCLRGHVARANPVWQDIGAGVDALAIFHGPQGYVSPSWYPAKQEHGRVVPTWNYAVVHAYGKLRVIDDPAWLRAQMAALTTRQEASFAMPWSVADAPPDFVERLATAVVGIEIVVTRLAGKWKLSQNQPPEGRAGVVAGLEARGETELATLVAAASRTLR